MIIQFSILLLLVGATGYETRRLALAGRAQPPAPRETAPSRDLASAWTLALLALGVGLRYLVGLRGHNYDVESYLIVSDIYATGNNVYAFTGRYNYGPIWLHILGLLSWLSFQSADSMQAFLTLLTTLMTLADLGIFYVLRRKVSTRAGLLFFLNPIAIIISGYHRQFDNLALLVGLLAVLCWERAGRQWGKRKLLALGILGLSLVVKHVLIVFPLWLAFYEKSWRRRALVVALPLAIFFASFLPYWSDSNGGVLKNVFGHAASQTATFWKYFATCLTTLTQHLLGLQPKTLFLLTMAGGALLFKRDAPFRALATYVCVLLICSSSMENQYLAIPLLYVSIFPNSFFGLYTLFGAYYLCYSKQGLQFEALARIIPFDIQTLPDFYFVLTLLLGFIVAEYGKHIGAALHRRLNSPATTP